MATVYVRVVNVNGFVVFSGKREKRILSLKKRQFSKDRLVKYLKKYQHLRRCWINRKLDLSFYVFYK